MMYKWAILLGDYRFLGQNQCNMRVIASMLLLSAATHICDPLV